MNNPTGLLRHLAGVLPVAALGNGSTVTLTPGETSSSNVTLRSRPSLVAAAAVAIVTLYGAHPASGSNITLRTPNERVLADTTVAGTGTVSGGLTTPTLVGTPATGSILGDQSSVTFSLTVPSGADLLLVGVASWQIGMNGADSVTYNGTALTRYDKYTGVSGDDNSEFWYLVSPTATTANVVVSFSTLAYAGAVASCWDNVDTTTPIARSLGGAQSTSPISLSIATDNANQLVVDCLDEWSANAASPGGGQTDIGDSNPGGGSSEHAHLSYKAATGSNVSMSWSWTGGGSSGPLLAVVLNPAAGAGGVNGTLSQTLADTTLAGTGTVLVTGTTNATLADVTLAGTGGVLVTGTLGATLADTTLAGTGTVSSGVSGSLSVTLADTTLAGAGTVAVSGSLSQTLGAATLAGTGTVLVTGTAANTLDATTLAGTAGVRVAATLGATLADTTLTGSGTVGTPPVIGTLNVTLDDTVLSGTGTSPAPGVFVPMGAFFGSRSQTWFWG